MEEIRPSAWDLRLQEIIDLHAVRLRDDVQRLLGDLPLQAGPQATDSIEPPSRADEEALARLKDSVQSIQAASGQRDLAGRILEAATTQARRAALFLARGNMVRGYDQRGFLTPGLDLSHFQATPLAGDPLMEALAKRETIHLQGCALGDSVLTDWLGGEEPTQVCLAPLVVGDRGVAILYADSGPDSEDGWIRPEAVEILASVASLYLERLRLPISDAGGVEEPVQPPAEPSIPSSMRFSGDRPDEPGLSPDQTVRLSPPEEFPSPDPSPFESEIASSLADVGSSTPPSYDLGEPEEEEIPTFQPDETVRLSLSETMRMRVDEVLAPQAAKPKAPSPVPAPAVAPQPAAKAAPPDPREADAARFARLLVSEIVLYNDSEVKAGRRHADLYDRLKEPIDMSSDAFRDRFGAGPLERHLEEELIRTLALGNRSLLGSKFPAR